MNWSFVLENNAKELPGKEAIIFGERRLTYRDLNTRVNALAKGLLDLGVGREDVVALLLYNCPEFVELTFAVNKIGAIWLPLNFRLAGEEIVYVLNHGDVKVLVSEMDFSEAIINIKDNLPKVKEYICIGEYIPTGWKSYEAMVKEKLGSTVSDAEVELDDIHKLLYTSGTTAHPKGAVITYGNLLSKNLSHAVEFKICPDDKAVMAAPMFHIGFDIAPSTIWFMGGSVVILRRFDPKEVLEIVQRERLTIIPFVPAMLLRLFQEPAFDNYDLSSVRLIIDGGEKIPVPTLEKIREKFPDAWFARGYGLTETVSGDTFLKEGTPIEKMVSDGKPVPGVRVRIVNDDGKELSAGKWGEVVIKGPKVFKGYWKNDEATAEAIKGGWFHTGDIGYLDEEGYLYIEDRKKDMIISGGENIASAEVERVIYELSQVLEVAVVGIPHPKWLEVPKAFVVLKEGETLTEQNIVDHCLKKLAKFKVPKEIEFTSQLPRTPSGKVLKRDLRKGTLGGVNY